MSKKQGIVSQEERDVQINAYIIYFFIGVCFLPFSNLGEAAALSVEFSTNEYVHKDVSLMHFVAMFDISMSVLAVLSTIFCFHFIASESKSRYISGVLGITVLFTTIFACRAVDYFSFHLFFVDYVRLLIFMLIIRMTFKFAMYKSCLLAITTYYISLIYSNSHFYNDESEMIYNTIISISSMLVISIVFHLILNTIEDKMDGGILKERSCELIYVNNNENQIQ